MAYITKMRAHIMRDVGAMQSPQNAFYTNLGLETLALRVERHCSNALAVAKFLKEESEKPEGKISWVNYPELDSGRNGKLCRKYLPHGSCGVISFGVKGGKEGAARFMEGLTIAALVVHVADVRTCVLHPATTTHRQLSDSELEKAGVSADLIRMSVGIEDIEDLMEDIKQALSRV